MYRRRAAAPVVLNALRRIFGRSHAGPAAVSPEQADIRLKSLKAKLVKNKGEAKRLSSLVEKQATLKPETKAQHKARLVELERERKDIVREMKGLHKRLPKK